MTVGRNIGSREGFSPFEFFRSDKRLLTCCCAQVNREGRTDCENQQECDPVLEKGLAPSRRKAASLLPIWVQMQSDCRFQGMKVERVLIDGCYFYAVKIK